MTNDIQNLFQLDGKVAIVTGASRGNGAAISGGLLAMGSKVYGLDMNIKQPLSEFVVKKCDVTDSDEVKKVINEIFDAEGHIDILVNNAGVTFPGTGEDVYPLDKWEKTLKVNLTAPFICSQIVAGFMKKNNSGSIINITSLSAEKGFPKNPAYTASKGGLKMLTKALASEWAVFGIRVNNICPGYIRTQMTRQSYLDENIRRERECCMMIKRWGEPRDLIGAAVFLASEASSYITGHDIFVDGGWVAKGFPDVEHMSSDEI